MRSIFATVMVTAIAWPATAAPVPKKLKDEVAIRGVWRLEKVDLGGATTPLDDKSPRTTFTFEDGKLKAEQGDNPPKHGHYKLDPAARTIDFDLGKRTYPGLYTIDGDTLRIALSKSDRAARPATMNADGKTVAVYVYKRVKDAKKDE